jgi:hypothetical protein
LDRTVWQRLAAIDRFGDVDTVLATCGSPLSRAIVAARGWRSRKGWEAALERATAVENMLARLVGRVEAVCGTSADLDCLVRGSLAQGIVTTRSDIDFEISGPSAENGAIGVERMVAQICRLLGWNAEGSEGRPTEIDLDFGTVSRDLHEWMELRRVGMPERDRGWMHHHPSRPSGAVWEIQSTFERAGRPTTAKFAFFEARSAIARLAWRAQCPFIPIPLQLDYLAGIVSASDVANLRAIARDCLDAYESGAAGQCPTLRHVRQALDDLRARHGLPGPAQAAGNSISRSA